MDGTIHSGLSPTTLIIDQKNAPTDLPIGHSEGGVFTAEEPSF